MTAELVSRERPAVPSSTYRLQVNSEFGFADAAAVADHLQSLGVSHVYLSPVLQPTVGSAHGYDVTDHTRLNAEAGGREAFDSMVRTFHAHGLGLVVDLVPNHMAIPTPEYRNAPLWSVLRDGRQSPYVLWFDIDWPAGGDTIIMPILGGSLEDALTGGQLQLVADGGPGSNEPVVRYYEHELPVRPGTEGLPLADLLQSQWWTVQDWRTGSTDLNYRRFFDVTSLIAVRVEIDEVFDASHALLLELVRNGSVDGLRVDHPDGLADPRGYVRRLAEATDDAWVVVEKILEGDEQLPADWPCAGTTGYDALWRIGGLFVDPAGEEPLTDLLALLSGTRSTLDEVVITSKQEIVSSVLVPEVDRLRRRVADVTQAGEAMDRPSDAAVHRALGALLVAIDRYRAYLVPGEPVPPQERAVIDQATERARGRLAEQDYAALDLVHELVLGQVSGSLRDRAGDAVDDLLLRFQQTCGPVMAKGIEDTAFYRWHRLVGLNEVGGDPDHFAVSPEELMTFVARTSRDWPATMTTLSTHDTKRAEDVRARLSVLSERPRQWEAWVREAQETARPHRSHLLDGATEYLLWQTLVGAWPIDEQRLQAYALKAVRESKLHTRWTDPGEAYESAVARFVSGVLGDPDLVAHLGAWVEQTASLVRAVTLGQKLLQLVLFGVPDVYQGTEVVDLSLVDPDNRRPVDFESRRNRLSRLDEGSSPQDLDDEKLLVTSRALRLRREHPEWFVGAAATVATVLTSDPHAFALARGDASGDQVVAVVTRLAGSLAQWGEASVAVPAGEWTDLLTGRSTQSDGQLSIGALLDSCPVALLVRSDA